jgi:hypothetical protein
LKGDQGVTQRSIRFGRVEVDPIAQGVEQFSSFAKLFVVYTSLS